MKIITKRMIARESFTIGALRLIERLDSHCRDLGYQAYLKEQDIWNKDYASDVYLLMGEVFEIMRLHKIAKDNKMVVEK